MLGHVFLYEGLSAAMRGYQRKLVLENIVGNSQT